MESNNSTDSGIWIGGSMCNMGYKKMKISYSFLLFGWVALIALAYYADAIVEVFKR